MTISNYARLKTYWWNAVRNKKAVTVNLRPTYAIQDTTLTEKLMDRMAKVRETLKVKTVGRIVRHGVAN